uniref:Uncharacterized protein n=1 Tax=Anguilla anguilla TaxID=7936 RepID=A0A0E9TMA1_ANGAN
MALKVFLFFCFVFI